MARVNVYLPDDLAARAKEADLNISALTQDAIEHVLAGRDTDAWLETTRELEGTGISHDLGSAALDAARLEFDVRE